LSEVAEETITDAVAGLLRQCGWEVIATHHPGAQGGFRISVPGGKGAGDIIPDVVAVRGNEVLVVESKPRFVRADLRKMTALRDDECRCRNLLAQVGLGDYPAAAVRVGLAMAGVGPADIPTDVVVFTHTGEGTRVRPAEVAR
jgi:hypothetical protein